MKIISKTNHTPLPLSLLVATLATANDVYTALAVDHLAVLAHALYSRAHAVLALLHSHRSGMDARCLD